MVHGKADVTFSLCRSSLFWDVTQHWLAVSDVSGQPTGTTVKCQAFQELT